MMSKKTASDGRRLKQNRFYPRKGHESRRQFALRNAKSTRPSHACGNKLVVSLRTKILLVGNTLKAERRPFGHLTVANDKNEDLEQRLQNYAQHMVRIQQTEAQQISQFEQQRIQMQYEIKRMHFEVDELRRQRSDPDAVRDQTNAVRSG